MDEQFLKDIKEGKHMQPEISPQEWQEAQSLSAKYPIKNPNEILEAFNSKQEELKENLINFENKATAYFLETIEERILNAINRLSFIGQQVKIAYTAAKFCIDTPLNTSSKLEVARKLLERIIEQHLPEECELISLTTGEKELPSSRTTFIIFILTLKIKG